MSEAAIRDGSGMNAGAPLSAPILRLVEALARQDAEDYLRETGPQDVAGSQPPQNHVLPDLDAAA